MTASRTMLYRRIHGAMKRAGMGEDAYRALLSGFGVDSKTALREAQLREMLTLIQGRGGASVKRRPAHQRKIVALWIELAHAGIIRDRRDSAIDAFVKRQTGIDALRFLTPRHASAVIVALEAMKTQVPADA